MARCHCEGTCPACRKGEVEDHKCDRCNREFCPDCHGVLTGEPNENVDPCSCEKAA